MQVLDREQQSTFNVPVAATDNGGLMVFTTVHISVTDQNDNVPQFLAQEYEFTVLDITPLNNTILKVICHTFTSSYTLHVLYFQHHVYSVQFSNCIAIL